MIIVNIMCGLGNQMFQYATGRALAHKLNTDLKLALDEEHFKEISHISSFQLNKFDIQAEVAEKEETKISKPKNPLLRFINFARVTLKKITLLQKLVFFLRKHCGMPVVPEFFNEGNVFNEAKGKDWSIKFKPELLDMPDGTFLYGYFPSYKYFDNIKELIVKDFTLKEPLTAKSKEIEEQINNSNSVCIHFRRGDAVKNPIVAEWYRGIVTDEYYKNAIDYITKKVEDPHFFVFSNDMKWVKENFKIPFKTTYVDHNDAHTAYEDLHLMSKCKHSITTGGSSFSWWAAYLNQNPDKIVIRTKDNCTEARLNIPDDLFPENWVIVES